MKQHIKNEATPTGKITVSVPVTFQAYGRIELEFDSVADMNQKLTNKAFVDDLALPSDWDYVDESFEIDFEGLENN